MNILIKYRKIIIIFFIIIALLFGAFIYTKLDSNSIKYILDNSGNFNYINIKLIILHIVLLSLSLLFSSIFIGVIFIMIYLLFECVVIGFISSYYISLYKFNGLCYSFLYVLIYKLLNIFLLIILIIKYIKIIRYLIKYLKNRQINITQLIFNSVIIIFIIILNDIFLYFFGKKILNIFLFLLK